MKTSTITDVIRMLQEALKEQGDLEVFMENNHDACFDGIGKMAVIQTVKEGVGTKPGFKALIILRNKHSIKP